MNLKDPYQVVRDFEASLCEYTGAPYCVTVDSCTNAIFLCAHLWMGSFEEDAVSVPRITYPGVPAAITHAGGCVWFEDRDWQLMGYYDLPPSPIVDSAKMMRRGMYNMFTGMYVCLSFHAKKALPIGRGGAILTDNKAAADWFRCARFDGRHEVPLHEDELTFAGWNCYMTPEQAARGLTLLPHLPDVVVCKPDPYQDLSKYPFYRRTEYDRHNP